VIFKQAVTLFLYRLHRYFCDRKEDYVKKYYLYPGVSCGTGNIANNTGSGSGTCGSRAGGGCPAGCRAGKESAPGTQPIKDHHVDYRYCLELKTNREITECRYKKK
jgi:hypothetical protein